MAAATNRIGTINLTDYKGGEDDNLPNDVNDNSSVADGSNASPYREPVVVSLRHP